jgi:hypothetical protein
MGFSDKKSGRFLKKAAQKFCSHGACGIETAWAKRSRKLLFVHKKKPSLPR